MTKVYLNSPRIYYFKCINILITFIGLIIATRSKNITPINNKIKAEKVLLINAVGEKMGIVEFAKAIEEAKNSSLDLVQVSHEDADPIVCKIMDYGKYIFDKKKSLSSSRVKVKIQSKK